MIPQQAFYTLCLVLGAPIGGLVGGYVTVALGWRWTAYIPAIVAGGLLLLAFFCVPETFYERQVRPDVILSRPNTGHDTPKTNATTEHVEGLLEPSFKSFTFTRSLKLGIYRPGLLKRMVTPYKVLRLPGTWMVTLHYGGLVGLIVTTSTVGPQILSAPPFFWGARVGLVNVGGIAGGVLGLGYAYLSSDWWVKRRAKQELHGLAEPETRLPLMLPSLVITTAGPLVFGLCATNPTRDGWVGLCFGLGMVCFGLLQVGSIGFNYILDAYGGLASDCCKLPSIFFGMSLLRLTVPRKSLMYHPISGGSWLHLDVRRWHVDSKQWCSICVCHVHSYDGRVRSNGLPVMALRQEAKDFDCRLG